MRAKMSTQSCAIPLPYCRENAQPLTGLQRESDFLLLRCMHICFCHPDYKFNPCPLYKIEKKEKKGMGKKDSRSCLLFLDMKHSVYKMKFWFLYPHNYVFCYSSLRIQNNRWEYMTWTFKTELSHSIDVWHWTSYLISLFPQILTYKERENLKNPT